MLSGLIGEPNYTGFFYFGSIIYFIYTKKYRYIPIALVIILSCASRTFLICSVVSILIYFLSFNLKRLLSYLILYSVISYPILVSLLYQFSDTSFHLLATKITNGRFAIHCVYLDMFLKNPLGVGFFNGAKRFAQQRANEANVFPIHDMDLYISNYQQHSLNFQILSEFGIIGYLLFCYFIFSLHKHVSSYSSKLALLLTLFIFPTMQLNVTNEIIVYLMISLILIYLNTKKKDQLFSKHSH
ncbi:O-antigen ligase family protein [Bacteriovorax sp. Seq25_V]|uniref:O-antigen ligase family protein n=1 Tax=Bacteriovorax sp. Seq25_V TaxID=1201288 RepID=UPI0012FB2162|nr:O-antigen ligase family protein [Bacteriovorax sp. Seq25_V]